MDLSTSRVVLTVSASIHRYSKRFHHLVDEFPKLKRLDFDPCD